MLHRTRLTYEHKDGGVAALDEIADILAPILGWDAGRKDTGLMSAWADYLVGGNGLSGASHDRDPHWRPDPLVTSWRPPIVYRLTRGGAVDAALAALAKAEPAQGNVAKVKAATTALKSIPAWKVKA